MKKTVKGLRNLGNTCYMNSALQSLIPLNNFWQILFKEDPSHPLVDHMKNYINSNGVLTPNDARRWFVNTLPYFKNYRQHDSHEALVFIIDNLLNSVQKLFESKQQTTVTCCYCNYSTTAIHPAGICSVPFTDDLFKSYEIYSKQEENVEWKCDNCKRTGKCKKKIVIEKVPEILMIHLKRWDNNRRKISNILDIPKTIYKRELKSFIRHSGGSAGGGHYVCYLNYYGKWWFTSDSTVKEISLRKAIDAMGHSYIFIYA